MMFYYFQVKKSKNGSKKINGQCQHDNRYGKGKLAL